MPMALLPTRDELAAELKVFIPKVGRWRLESSCGICGIEFSYLRGRHHCRYCGASVCGKHSRNRAVVPSSMSTEKQRVCDMCYPKCQYGIAHQRPRGMTTASSRRGNFTLLDVHDTDDPRLVKTERGRARTRLRSRSNSKSPRWNGPKATADDWNSKASWQPQDSQSPQSQRRRRGISEPPERRMKGFKALPPTPPPVSPHKPKNNKFSAGPSHDNGHDVVFHLSPEKKVGSPRFQPSKHKSSKTLSIRKQLSSPPPPRPLAMPHKPTPFSLSSPVHKKPAAAFHIPEHHPFDASFAMSDFASSFASVRDTEQDAIAMQYLSSFVKADNVMTLERSQVTVSHECAGGPTRDMATLIEMKPASPKELQLASSEASPLQTGNTKPQNRKMSTSSTCTVSISDSEELDEEKPLGGTAAEWDARDSSDDAVQEHENEHDDDVALAFAAWSTVEVDQDRSSSELSPTHFKQPKAGQQRPSVTFAIDTASSARASHSANSEEEYKSLVDQVMELEKQIHQYQSELPALIEEWKHVERMTTILRADASESRDKVRQYQKARAVVSRAIRVATKCLQEKEYEAAILELSRAAAIERTNAKVWYLLAESRMKIGQSTEAEDACRISLGLQHSAVGVALLGRILHQLGRHDEAIQCYLTALGR